MKTPDFACTLDGNPLHRCRSLGYMLGLFRTISAEKEATPMLKRYGGNKW